MTPTPKFIGKKKSPRFRQLSIIKSHRHAQYYKLTGKFMGARPHTQPYNEVSNEAISQGRLGADKNTE